MDSPKIELITLTPVPARTPSSAVKRKITPSAELSSPKKQVILTPKGLLSDGQIADLGGSSIPNPSRFLLPQLQSIIERRDYHTVSQAHPEPLQLRSEPITSGSKHVILPFNLQTSPESYRDHENRNLLNKIFPGTTAVAFDKICLIFVLKHLPTKPWPHTIAGVPPYLTTDPNDGGPLMSLFKRTGQSRIHLSREIDGRSEGFETVFAILREWFETIKIDMNECQWHGAFVVIVLADTQTSMTDIPRTVAKMPCYYFYEEETSRPTDLPALRKIEPSDAVADDSVYTTLRPGVMVSSERSPSDQSEWLSSSGVLLRHDQSGVEYLTVASHGFPHGKKVFHPKAQGREIGEIVRRLPHTDMALVKLKDGTQYVNETFESPNESAPVRLKGLAKGNETKMGTFLSMETPFMGFIMGTYGCLTRLRVPSDDATQPEQEWRKMRWDYLGQGMGSEVKEGVCGSAMWNEDSKVVGFFHWASAAGFMRDWTLSLPADHLIDAGYSLVLAPGA